MLYQCTNLTCQTVTTGVPWEFVPKHPVPENVCKDKTARQEWYRNPHTQHCFYSGIAGLNDTARVSSNNPPHSLHALVLDCDLPLNEKILDRANKLKFKPNYIEKSLGGNYRLIWLFEKPIKLGSADVASYIQKKLADFLDAKKFPGLDDGALRESSRMFCVGHEWTRLHDAPLPHETIFPEFLHWMKKFNFKDDKEVAIPLPEIEKALLARYPNFTWPSSFELESMGPSFWIPESTSPKSAMLKKGGFYTFAGHADKQFYSWADLLGKEFVAKWRTNEVVELTKDIHFDGKHFWAPALEDKGWDHYSDGAMASHLKCTRKAHPSLIEECLDYIRKTSRVAGGAPFLMDARKVIDMGDVRTLNTYIKNCVIPVTGPQVWGRGGLFAFISEFYGGLFKTELERQGYLAWLKHAYECCLFDRPESGQAVFIVGGVGIGKTMNSHALVGPLLGGAVDASDYLLGRENFGGENFRKPLMCVDDEMMSSDGITNRKFTSNIKRLVANPLQRHNLKFMTSCMVMWTGRIIVTLNPDPASLQALPQLDVSILDKLCLFRAQDDPFMKFPPSEKIRDILKKELPHFARWLLDWKIPDHLIGSTRFKIQPTHNAEVIVQAHQSSTLSTFQELLEETINLYFAEHPKDDEFKINATKLFREMAQDPRNDALIRSFKVGQVHRYLQQLAKSGHICGRSETDDRGLRVWIFERPKRA